MAASTGTTTVLQHSSVQGKPFQIYLLYPTIFNSGFSWTLIVIDMQCFKKKRNYIFNSFCWIF